MNLSLMNRLLFEFILCRINGYCIHFKAGKHFKKDVDHDLKVRGLYAISSNSLTFNVTQRRHVLKKTLQVNRLVIYRCKMLLFIKQNRFF
jgi:hypothetical protein